MDHLTSMQLRLPDIDPSLLGATVELNYRNEILCGDKIIGICSVEEYEQIRDTILQGFPIKTFIVKKNERADPVVYYAEVEFESEVREAVIK
jgi:hypothetical protein